MNTRVEVEPYAADGVLVMIGKNPPVPLTKEAALRLAEKLMKLASA